MKDSALNDFCLEVNRNRSALLRRDFKSTWGFLGLNPDFLNSEKASSCMSWFNNVFQFSFIEEILHSNNSNEIFIHDESDLCDEDLLYSLENVALINKKKWNTATPYLSTKINLIDQNFRLTLIHPSITSHDRPRAFLRRLGASPIPIKDYSPHKLLEDLIRGKKNILVSGSTGSGKTTLIQAMLHLCSKTEHLVILEDTHEIFLEEKKATHFLSNENNSLIDYCSHALRISPDRLILGELRGEEVLPLTLAMNTGHQGFLSTIHADNAIGAIQRLKTLLEFFAPQSGSCFQMICQNIDIVIHMKDKRIEEIIQIRGTNGNLPLYEYLFRNETILAHEEL